MENSRAVVVPFGVPSEGRGLGLGLAALVHSFAQVDGSGVAIAQLQARERGQGTVYSPVEAFLSPSAWRDIAGRGDGPAGVGMVLTGAFEPPSGGQGTIQLLAFDPRDGRTRAKMDVPLDEQRAGASIVEALDELWTSVGGGIGALTALRDLEWDSLESVLRAERCALHDPARGGRHDRLAAMLHLGRAIGDAPSARYPAERLASIALETAVGPALDPKLASAAVRALERAVTDASTHVELVEALAALLLRLGQPREAERRMNTVIAIAPTRPRPYALLAQSLRAQGRLDDAQAALVAGAAASSGDVLLTIERGMVLTAMGDLRGAGAAWREVLARDPANHVAFGRLGAMALVTHDTATAQSLVDAALGARDAHPDVFRGAVRLALDSEADGLARASRIQRLCQRLIEQVPDDAAGLLALARALVVLGERSSARVRLAQIERVAPQSAPAAEAQLVRLALDSPNANLEVGSVLRAARSAATGDLADVAARGRRLATAHGAWMGWLAAGVAERRRGRWEAARGALELALEIAPGAVAVRLEMADALQALEDTAGAVSNAEALVTLEGPTPKSLGLLARAQAAAGRDAEAVETARRALSMQPEDQDVVALLRRLRRRREATWSHRLARLWKRWSS